MHTVWRTCLYSVMCMPLQYDVCAPTSQIFSRYILECERHTIWTSHNMNVTQYERHTIRTSHNMNVTQYERHTIWTSHNMSVTQYERNTIWASHNMNVTQYERHTIWTSHNMNVTQYERHTIWTSHNKSVTQYERHTIPFVFHLFKNITFFVLKYNRLFKSILNFLNYDNSKYLSPDLKKIVAYEC